MKKSVFLPVLLTLCCIVALSVSAVENENGILIDTGRVFHGANTGQRYYGYSGGAITLPSARGGVLSFDLWNDNPLNGPSILNYFRTEIAGQTILIPSYSTKNQIFEPYAEDRGWGAAGVQRVRIGIPAGLTMIRFDHPQSQTGVELSNFRFAEGAATPPQGWAADVVRNYGEPVVEVGRIMHGKKTGTLYYGYTGGTIHLPHGNGGFLSFKYWNDQYKGHSWTLNRLTVTVGTRKESFEQYTTSMDLEEFYAETDNDHGPAGGGEIVVQLPAGIYKVQFDGAGSMMGIELSDVSFTQGSPVSFSFRPKSRATDRVLVDLGRIFTGTKTGRKFYGYASGSIILPDNKGGTLHFRLWNDHPGTQPTVNNSLVIKAGTASQTFANPATLAEKAEAYVEDPGWGPSGGREIVFQVPAGVGFLEVRQGQSETGIELSDLWFTGGR